MKVTYHNVKLKLPLHQSTKEQTQSYVFADLATRLRGVVCFTGQPSLLVRNVLPVSKWLSSIHSHFVCVIPKSFC